MGVTFEPRTGAPIVDGNESFEDSVVYIGQALTVLGGEVGWKQVTSGTRPATPYPGETIFETDTRRYFVYDDGIDDWFKVGGPNSNLVDIGTFTSGNIANTGAFVAAWNSGNFTIPYAGMLNVQVGVTMSVAAAANAGGWWRPTLGNPKVAIPTVTDRRFGNYGAAPGQMPAGVVTAQVAVAKGVQDLGVEVRVDVASAICLVHPGGTFARVWI